LRLSARRGETALFPSTFVSEDGQFVAAASLKDDRCLDTDDPRSVREVVEGEVLQMLRVLPAAAVRALEITDAIRSAEKERAEKIVARANRIVD
jgi:hypothetical protein